MKLFLEVVNIKSVGGVKRLSSAMLGGPIQSVEGLNGTKDEMGWGLKGKVLTITERRDTGEFPGLTGQPV